MNTKFEKIVFAIADADETWNVFILVAALVCAAFIGIGVAV